MEIVYFWDFLKYDPTIQTGGKSAKPVFKCAIPTLKKKNSNIIVSPFKLLSEGNFGTLGGPATLWLMSYGQGNFENCVMAKPQEGYQRIAFGLIKWGSKIRSFYLL